MKSSKYKETSNRPFKQANILWNRNGIESTDIYPVRVLVGADSGYIGELFLFKSRDLAESFCYGLRVKKGCDELNYEILDFTEDKNNKSQIKLPSHAVIKDGEANIQG
jgi:hypothetical protein